MRITVHVNVFLNPEVLQRDRIDKDQAMGMVGNMMDEALTELGDLVNYSSIITSTSHEGPDAAN